MSQIMTIARQVVWNAVARRSADIQHQARAAAPGATLASCTVYSDRAEARRVPPQRLTMPGTDRRMPRVGGLARAAR